MLNTPKAHLKHHRYKRRGRPTNRRSHGCRTAGKDRVGNCEAPRESAAGVWKAVKDIDSEKVKQLLNSATGISEYNAGGDRALHQGGKHSVQMAMFAFGAIKGITKGKELIENGGDVKKLVKVSDDLDVDASIKIKSFDQSVSDNIYKSVAIGDYAHEMAETVIQETAEAERRLGRKYTWPEVQALFKREMILMIKLGRANGIRIMRLQLSIPL